MHSTDSPVLSLRVKALAALYQHIAATRMQGIPLLNPAVQVQAVGFELVQADASDPEAPAAGAGVLITPWFMNLVWLPLQRLDRAKQVGGKVPRYVGRECFEFIGAHEDGFGSYEACSLFSPVFEFDNHQAAVATAQAVLETLRQPASCCGPGGQTRPGRLAASPCAPRLPLRAIQRRGCARQSWRPAVADASLSLDRLAGALTVRPGLAAPGNLLNTRPDWVAHLTQGKPASTLPDLLASLFNLCGQAHRLCASLALQAAGGQTGSLTDTARSTLQTETLREHLRRIGLDWPGQLAATPDACSRAQTLALKALQACPLSMGASPAGQTLDFPGLEAWLGQQLLGMPARQWLRQWECNPHGFMSDWCASTPGWLPELLQGCKAVADLAMPGAPALRPHASRQELLALAGDLRSTPSFTRQPLWRGHCAETGPWTRLNQHAPARFDTPWLRLGARLAELVRLSLPDEAAAQRRALAAGRQCLPGRQRGAGLDRDGARPAGPLGATRWARP